MKQKTNSGAKKRLAPKKSGVVKRRQARRRHLLKNRGQKAKRHLASPAYVHSANMIQTKRLLAI